MRGAPNSLVPLDDPNDPHSATSRLGISRALVYRLIADGELRSIKLRGRRLIESNEIDRFIEALREGGSR